MRNREYKALVTFMLMISLTVSSAAVSPSDAYAKEKAAVTAEASFETKKQEIKNNSTNPVKDETVYAKIDGNGMITSVIVSDQLKNIGNQKSIKDHSFLEKIENVKGDEQFTKKSGELIWQGDDQDICYQGTTKKKLPVGIEVSYELDGRKISADDLEGKSGHLKIQYKYSNITGTSNDKYTPFLMVTGLLLDTDKFTNVTVTNGKLISDGEREIALAMGIPKMKETLGIEDVDIPDSFEIEADVTDYEAVAGVTIAANDIFHEISTDKFENLSGLKDAMDELQSASKELVSGSGELKEGLDTLLSSSGTLIDGIGKLSDGSKALTAGTNSLSEGAGTLASGSASLSAGTKQLAEGTDVLAGGAKQVSDGIALASGKIPQLSQGISALHEGVEQAASGAASLDAGVDQAAAGAAGLQAGIQEVSTNAGDLANAAAAVAQYLGSQSIPVEETVAVDNSAAIDALRAVETEENAGQIESVIQMLAGQTAAISTTVQLDTSGAAQQAAAVAQGLSGISAALSSEGAIGGGVNAIYATLSSPEGSTVKAGSARLSAALNGGDGSLASGMDDLYNSVNGDGGLLQGIWQIAQGADSVAAGSAKINGKMKEASQGADSVAAGAAQLSSGAKDLNSGAGTLKAGIDTLSSGSGELADGVKKLDEGAAKLNDGMIRFDEEGIQKLVSAFDGDIDGMLDKLNEMLDASKAYNNFTGLAEGMDGEVKFIFVMDK